MSVFLSASCIPQFLARWTAVASANVCFLRFLYTTVSKDCQWILPGLQFLAEVLQRFAQKDMIDIFDPSLFVYSAIVSPSLFV